MNLTKAFVERNRLKSYISELTHKLSMISVFHDKKIGERDWKGEKTIDELLEKVIEAKTYFAEFNTAIDKANNIKSRVLLNRLESTKANLSTVDYILSKVIEVNLKQIDYTTGQENIVENVIDVDTDKLKSYQKDFKRKIRNLEDEISATNAETQVIISKELEDFLETYNN